MWKTHYLLSEANISIGVGFLSEYWERLPYYKKKYFKTDVNQNFRASFR